MIHKTESIEIEHDLTGIRMKIKRINLDKLTLLFLQEVLQAMLYGQEQLMSGTDI